MREPTHSTVYVLPSQNLCVVLSQTVSSVLPGIRKSYGFHCDLDPHKPFNEGPSMAIIWPSPRE